MSTATNAKTNAKTRTDLDEAAFALLPPIFRRCARRHPHGETAKHDVRAPAVIGDHAYATDGRILVRCPIPDDAKGLDIRSAIETAREGRLPFVSAAAMFEQYRDYPGEGVAPPDLSGQPECFACDGSGGVVCPCCRLLVEACDYCDGSGVEGGADDGMPVAGGPLLAFRFIRLLSVHGAAIYLPPPTPDDSLPFLFVADGGIEGLVMPLDKRKGGGS